MSPHCFQRSALQPRLRQELLDARRRVGTRGGHPSGLGTTAEFSGLHTANMNGAGVDINVSVSRRMACRACEINWLGTQLSNSAQNGIGSRNSAGVRRSVWNSRFTPTVQAAFPETTIGDLCSRDEQFWVVVSDVPNCGGHLPCLHLFCRNWFQKVGRQQRRFSRGQPPLMVLPMQYDGHPIMDR
jgi:hypothetical protein